MRNNRYVWTEAEEQKDNPILTKKVVSFMSGGNYEIKVAGHLDQHWSEWLGGLAIAHDDGHTLLTGFIPDQSALYGILGQISNLGLTLISLKSSEKDE